MYPPSPSPTDLVHLTTAATGADVSHPLIAILVLVAIGVGLLFAARRFRR